MRWLATLIPNTAFACELGTWSSIEWVAPGAFNIISVFHQLRDRKRGNILVKLRGFHCFFPPADLPSALIHRFQEVWVTLNLFLFWLKLFYFKTLYVLKGNIKFLNAEEKGLSKIGSIYVLLHALSFRYLSVESNLIRSSNLTFITLT